MNLLPFSSVIQFLAKYQENFLFRFIVQSKVDKSLYWLDPNHTPICHFQVALKRLQPAY